MPRSLRVPHSFFDIPAPEIYSRGRDWGRGPASCNVLVLCVLQKFKEYVNGSNLITKLQAKHDLLRQTLGEGESGGGGLREGAVFPAGFGCAPWSCFSLRHGHLAEQGLVLGPPSRTGQATAV